MWSARGGRAARAARAARGWIRTILIYIQGCATPPELPVGVTQVRALSQSLTLVQYVFLLESQQLPLFLASQVLVNP